VGLSRGLPLWPEPPAGGSYSLFAFDGPTTFQGTYDGDTRFFVDAVPLDPSETRSPVFSETDQFDGETTARAETSAYLNIDADADWTLSTG